MFGFVESYESMLATIKAYMAEIEATAAETYTQTQTRDCAAFSVGVFLPHTLKQGIFLSCGCSVYVCLCVSSSEWNALEKRNGLDATSAV